MMAVRSLSSHLALEDHGEARAARQQQRHRRRAAAEQALRDLDRRAEVRRVEPGRAGVLDLVEQRGHPRQVEQPDHAEADQRVAHEAAAVLGHVPARHERDDRARRHEQPPVVRVDEEAEEDDERGQVAAPAEGEHVQEGRRGEQREQQHERVHARLLRVVGEERVDRAEGGADQPGAPPEQAPAGPQPARDREQGHEHREPLRVGRAVAEDVDPDGQQHVVERRRAVHPEHARDVEERLRGDPDREALVHPERVAERLRPQVGGDHQQHGEHRRRHQQTRGKRAYAREGTGAGRDACHRAIVVIRPAISACGRVQEGGSGGAVGASGPARGHEPIAPCVGAVSSRHLPLVVDEPEAVVRGLRHERAVGHRAGAEDGAGRGRGGPAHVDPVEVQLVGHHLSLEGPAVDASAGGDALSPADLGDHALEVVPELGLVAEAARHAAGVVGLLDDERREDGERDEERDRGRDRARLGAAEGPGAEPADALEHPRRAQAAEHADRGGRDDQVALVAREPGLGHRGHEHEPGRAAERDRHGLRLAPGAGSTSTNA